MAQTFPFMEFYRGLPHDAPVPPVFPCVPWHEDSPSLAPEKRGKRPLTENGCKGYARNHDELRSFAENFPDANIGYAPEPAGLCVIDIDGPEGEDALFELELKHAALPSTYEVKTPRGRHLYFRGSLPASTSKLARNVDTRGRGSYVLAPGSRVNGAIYHVTCKAKPAQLPDWIAEYFTAPAQKQNPSPFAGLPVDEQTLCTVLGYLNPDVDRNTWRNIVAGIRATPLIDDPDELKRRNIADHWSQGQFWTSPSVTYEKEGRDAVDKVFDSMPPKKKGIGYASLVWMAKKKGYSKQRNSINQSNVSESFGVSQPGERFEIVNANDVVPKKVHWIWTDRLAQGKLLVLSGSPGQGKSQLGCYLSARISNGDPWVDGGVAPKGRTIVLSSEDGIQDTMVPRLMAAGADRSKIEFLRATIDPSGNKRRRAFSLQVDLDDLGERVRLYGDVKLIIVDPITSYMGDRTDTHQTSQVRSVLDPVSDWADRHNVAVLAISHPPKAAQSNALNAVTGSLAFVGVARLVFCAIEDASWPGHSLFLPVKNSLGPKAAGLRYSIEGCEIEGDGGTIRTSRIVWNTTVPVTISADEALTAGRTERRTPTKLERAKQFLLRLLENGPMAVKDIQKALEKEDFSWSTLETAKEQLPVLPRKTGLDGGWVWELIDRKTQVEDEECFS